VVETIAENFLNLFKAYYNHLRHQITLGESPMPIKGGTELLRFQNLIEEVMPNALVYRRWGEQK
jgi:hypothetical protein